MAVTVDILVQPRASRAKIGPMHDGRLKIESGSGEFRVAAWFPREEAPA